jgi:DNA-binding NarL/FixJ family response regulator
MNPALTPTKPIRLLVVDDHEVVRLGLRTLLNRDPELQIVGEAGTAGEAVTLAETLSPDVVLLDVRLPDADGFEVCGQLRDKQLACRVLVLTSYGDEATIMRAIAAGAEGYLLKEIRSEPLLQAIKNVAHGQAVLDPAVTRSVLGRMRSAGEPPPEPPWAGLSAQERRVIALVAEGKTNKEIAQEMGLSDKTVKNYLSHVMEKLQLTRRSQVAAFYVQHFK